MHVEKLGQKLVVNQKLKSYTEEQREKEIARIEKREDTTANILNIYK